MGDQGKSQVWLVFDAEDANNSDEVVEYPSKYVELV